MKCPKCGAQVDDKLTACPYCKAEIQAAEATTGEVKAADGQEAPAQAPAEEKKPSKIKETLAKINFKEPKTLLMCGAALLALFLVIAAVCGIVSSVKANTGPEKLAEKYVEAMADGNIKGMLKKMAPWAKRSTALGLGLKENASVGKIAKEYKELGGLNKMGKLKIEEVKITNYYDSDIGTKLSSMVLKSDAYESPATYKEIKAVTEIAEVTVEGTVKTIESTTDVTFKITCARYNGSWIVLEVNVSNDNVG